MCILVNRVPWCTRARAWEAATASSRAAWAAWAARAARCSHDVYVLFYACRNVNQQYLVFIYYLR